MEGGYLLCWLEMCHELYWLSAVRDNCLLPRKCRRCETDGQRSPSATDSDSLSLAQLRTVPFFEAAICMDPHTWPLYEAGHVWRSWRAYVVLLPWVIWKPHPLPDIWVETPSDSRGQINPASISPATVAERRSRDEPFADSSGTLAP